MRRKKKNKFYCIQCLRKFRRRDAPANEICPFCNVALRSNTNRIVAQVVTRLLRHRGLKPPKKKDDYTKYLESVLWKTIRKRILERDGNTCLMCGGKAEVVHHKSYDRQVLEGKRDNDLVSLCYGCHGEIEFTMDNGKRMKNGLRKANAKLHAAMARLARGQA